MQSKGFKSFLVKTFTVELALFLLSLPFVSAKGFQFSLSFVLGYVIVATDLVLIAFFSRKLPELAQSGTIPKSGLSFRLAVISALLFVFVLFTDVNLFAIILAVATGQTGLLITLLFERRELEEWKEQ